MFLPQKFKLTIPPGHPDLGWLSEFVSRCKLLGYEAAERDGLLYFDGTPRRRVLPDGNVEIRICFRPDYRVWSFNKRNPDVGTA